MDSPSEEIIKSAKKTVIVEDAGGRKIEIRKVKTLDRMRLLEIIGADNSENNRYLGLAMLAYSVVSIDGDSVTRPGTKLALEAIVQRLDDDGFDAVSQGVVEHFMPSAKTEDEVKQAIKNG